MNVTLSKDNTKCGRVKISVANGNLWHWSHLHCKAEMSQNGVVSG